MANEATRKVGWERGGGERRRGGGGEGERARAVGWESGVGSVGEREALGPLCLPACSFPASTTTTTVVLLDYFSFLLNQKW